MAVEIPKAALGLALSAPLPFFPGAASVGLAVTASTSTVAKSTAILLRTLLLLVPRGERGHAHRV